MNDRKGVRLFFVHNAPTTFVQDDVHILSTHYLLSEWFVRSRFRLYPLKLYHSLRACNVVYCWFASWHSVLPIVLARLLGIPAIVVTGGYDTAAVPEAGYGSQRGGLRKLVTNFVLRRSDVLLAISDAARKEICRIPAISRDKVQVIHCAVRPYPFTPLSKKERIALTVGGVWQENLLRKGLLPFVRAAQHLPDWRFVLVGRWHDDSIETLKVEAPENVEFTGFVNDEQLADHFARASVYVQASMHEGFGLSVAEAMTAGCWPVISNAGSLPEVVGKHGIILDNLEPASIASAIIVAHKRGGIERVEGAAWIKDRYSLSIREERITALISGMGKG